MGKGVFPDGIPELPSMGRFVVDSALATAVLGPVVMGDCLDTWFVAEVAVTADGTQRLSITSSVNSESS